MNMPLHQISVIPRDVTSSRVSSSGKAKEKDKQVCLPPDRHRKTGGTVVCDPCFTFILIVAERQYPVFTVLNILFALSELDVEKNGV